MISKEAKAIIDHIYIVYGSDTGYLFGIPPDKRYGVEAIVQCVLDIEEDAKRDESKEHTD